MAGGVAGGVGFGFHNHAAQDFPAGQLAHQHAAQQIRRNLGGAAAQPVGSNDT
jgi:hypothetical protein